MAMPAVPPKPAAIEAAAETALIVLCETPILPVVLFNSSTKVLPSGATSDQLWPATKVEIFSVSGTNQSAPA